MSTIETRTPATETQALDPQVLKTRRRSASLEPSSLPFKQNSPKPLDRLSLMGMSWLIGCLIFAGAIVWNGDSSSSFLSFEPAVQFKPIEQVRVGERALVDAPTAALAADEKAPRTLDLEEIIPSQWRLIRMQAIDTWDDGTVDDVNIETLQRLDWIEAQKIEVGSGCPVPLDLVEMGLPETLRAKVLAIDQCPAIEDGPGRLVLTTVNHLSNAIVELTTEDQRGERETLYPTAPHKFYSVTRDAWLSAIDLQKDEVLNGFGHQEIKVVGVERVPGVHRVYNVTVQGEHLYRVALNGLLVHNMDCFDAPSPGVIPNRLLRRQPDIDHVRGGSVENWEVRNGQFFSGDTPVHFGKARMNAQEGIDFVIGVDGKLRLGNRHTFLAELGGDSTQALAAGTLRLKGGRIKSITNLSGHFNPRVHEAKRYPELFKKAGFDVSGAGLEIYVPKAASGIERYTGGVQLHSQEIIP